MKKTILGLVALGVLTFGGCSSHMYTTLAHRSYVEVRVARRYGPWSFYYSTRGLYYPTWRSSFIYYRPYSYRSLGYNIGNYGRQNIKERPNIRRLERQRPTTRGMSLNQQRTPRSSRNLENRVRSRTR